MTPADREALRAELARRAREILERSHATVSQAKDALSVRTDVDDIGEISVDDAIKTTSGHMSDRDRASLVEIRDAIRRHQDGSYGRCIDCGEEIELERLRAVPWAARCEPDQEKQDETLRASPPSTL